MNQITIDTKRIELKKTKVIKRFNEIQDFTNKLQETGLFPLKPVELDILQINLGYLCNQACTHCHVNAGPSRKEIMTKETLQWCLVAIDNNTIKTIDLTGGAPEMNPNFEWFVKELNKRSVEIIVRSNLTILVSNNKFRKFPEFLKQNNVQIISSMPCYTQQNVDKQRGSGVFEKSIEALKLLNEVGYGKNNTDLKLHLVYNPGGAFLPGTQSGLQADYKKILLEKFGIIFNNLYTITNLPVNRFLDYLKKTGKYESYMITLANAFNPSAAMGVMCRNTLSVGWDGILYDCDFNQMLDLPIEAEYKHIKDFNTFALQKRNIVTGQHCYGCTAGEGSSCQGTIV
ncbi:MAG: radical SAM/Cys-rich domain protein [Chlorobi bacterium]|nr:radical SAM/Cys-rich domain protein [Chlorobiota bacterium]